jgi:hypothetical protein
MTNQNYLIIENNVVTNIVYWDGNTNTWQPPADSIQLIKSTVPALIWDTDGLVPPSWVLKEYMGVGDIGFLWDISTQILTTNQPKPDYPAPAKPLSTGTQPA